MDMSGFGYSRVQKLSGVSIDVTFDPTKLTPRICKAAQKMLRTKRIMGQGQAAKAALMAWAALPDPPAVIRHGALLNYKRLPPSVATQWRPLITMGRVIALSAPDLIDFYRDNAEGNYTMMMDLVDGKSRSRKSWEYLFLHNYPDELQAQFRKVFSEDVTNAAQFDFAANTLLGPALIKPNMDLISSLI